MNVENYFILVQHGKDFADREMRIYKGKVHVEMNE